MLPLRRAWAEVDLGLISHNLEQVRCRVGSGVKVLVAVKADAYGHGMVPVSKALADSKVDYLGVATPGEALRIREAGVTTPILVFGHVISEEVEDLLRYDLTLTAYSEEIIEILDREANRRGVKVKVHIKVDTGMGRMGIWHDRADGFVKKVYKLSSIDLEGIYTHFPSADELDKTFTHYQIHHFKALIRRLERDGIDIPFKHAANSAGVLDIEDSYFNLVRPGLMVYGIFPSEWVSRTLDLKSAFSLKTRIVELKKTPPGRSISYGREFVTSEETIIAILPVGYGDGYPHFLSNKAHVLIRGRLAPIVGRICMDQMMVDVGRIEGVKVGDEAVLIGRQEGDEIRVEELARDCGTIPYQILCWINQGVSRVYKNDQNFR